MKQMYKIKLALLILLFFQLVSCDKFEAHPYDVKIDGEVGINEKNIKKIRPSRYSPWMTFTLTTQNIM